MHKTVLRSLKTQSNVFLGKFGYQIVVRAEPPKPVAPKPAQQQKYISESVKQALALNEAELPRIEPTPAFQAQFENVRPPKGLTSEELFTLDGELLPCWREEDLTLYDDWLLDPTNYPYYYALFQHFAESGMPIRLLEIGVRTGYQGVVFAQAVNTKSFYIGVDPNQYLKNGLDLAGETLKRVRRSKPSFDFTLIENYSWDIKLQHSLTHSGPFELVHIDGDHTLEGKLVDLELARRIVTADGYVLVDDFAYHPPIGDAIRRALALGWYTKLASIPTKRGLAILKP